MPLQKTSYPIARKEPSPQYEDEAYDTAAENRADCLAGVWANSACHRGIFRWLQQRDGVQLRPIFAECL